jgi:predicted nucleotidyltransferase
MRLDDKIKNYLKQAIGEKIPGARLYLFGSRTDDNALGGDIDILVMTQTPVEKKIFRAIRVEFFKKFGWQKIDLVNFTFDDTSVFKQLIQDQAIELE